MLNRLQLSTILIIACLIWGGLLIAQGVAVRANWLNPVSSVIGLMVILLLGFEHWMWRLACLREWFVQRPDLRGTWTVELTSSWVDPTVQMKISPITAFLVIRQTYSTISARLLTAESSSELRGAEIMRATDGTYRLVGVYLNEPRVGVRDRSPIHFGALVIDVQGVPPSGLSGHYWTDRNTRGEIESKGHSRNLAARFAETGSA